MSDEDIKKSKDILAEIEKSTSRISDIISSSVDSIDTATLTADRRWAGRERSDRRKTPRPSKYMMFILWLLSVSLIFSVGSFYLLFFK